MTPSFFLSFFLSLKSFTPESVEFWRRRPHLLLLLLLLFWFGVTLFLVLFFPSPLLSSCFFWVLFLCSLRPTFIHTSEKRGKRKDKRNPREWPQKKRRETERSLFHLLRRKHTHTRFKICLHSSKRSRLPLLRP